MIPTHVKTGIGDLDPDRVVHGIDYEIARDCKGKSEQTYSDRVDRLSRDRLKMTDLGHVVRRAPVHDFPLDVGVVLSLLALDREQHGGRTVIDGIDDPEVLAGVLSVFQGYRLHAQKSMNQLYVVGFFHSPSSWFRR